MLNGKFYGMHSYGFERAVPYVYTDHGDHIYPKASFTRHKKVCEGRENEIIFCLVLDLAKSHLKVTRGWFFRELGPILQLGPKN